MAESRDTALVLAELAHELSQPLTGIRTSAELLLEARPSDPTVAARVAVIVRQAERVQLIVDRARRQSPAPQGALRADLNLAVEAAWALLEREAEQQGAVLERDLARELPLVAAEQIAVEQILGNLLRNALQAMKRGRVRVRTAAAAGGAEAVVEDDGPGIPAELRSRLFAPYATGREGGTGLGLRISRALAEEAGGTLEMLEGPGARFRLHLPFAT
jgi:signal transduction histidine kinase